MPEELKPCRVCKKDVASSAPTCPQCGAKEPAKELKPCRVCKKDVASSAPTCPQCGAKEPANLEISENPHKLWRQIVGFVFWVGGISLIRVVGGRANEGGNELGFMLVFTIGCLTFADAWVSGIYKDRSRKSFLNVSPMSWGIGMSLLPIVTFPVYIIMRNKLRTRNGGNGFFIALAVFSGVIIIGVIVAMVMSYYIRTVD